MTRRLRFGSHHQIDLAARELRDDGRLLHVSPRVFDCLAWLIEHRDRAVGRDELMAAIWGRADIADTQLAQIILKARRAIGDSGEVQHAIRTIAGFGYRWVAEVCADEAAPPTQAGTVSGAAKDAAAMPSARELLARYPRWLTGLVVIGTLALAGVAFSAWQWNRGSGHETPRSVASVMPAAADRTIAVLPATIEATPDSTWLRLGLMEFVAARLRNAGQTVAPGENVVSVMRASADAAALPAAVQRALDPRWIIVPNVRETDAGWSVSLELRARGADVREFPANAEDAITAARIASDRLLVALGRATSNAADAARQPIEELLSRIDAALLVDDLDGALRVLLAAGTELRSTPELRLREARIDFLAGHNADAAIALEKLRADVPAESDPVLHARIVSVLAAVEVHLGRAADAEESAGKALTLLDGRHEPALLGKTFMRRGAARALLGQHDTALGDFAQARVAMQLAGDPLGLAQVELNEGALNGVRNHPADALASFERAERGLQRFGVSSALANALGNQIVAHRVLLQPAAALEVSARGIALLTRLASPESARLLRLRRGQTLADVGRWGEASALFDQLSREIEPAREPDFVAMIANERARIELGRGEPRNALHLVEPAVARLVEAEFASTRAEAWFIAIRALHGLGRATQAATQISRFAEWAAAQDNSTFTIHADLVAAEQAIEEGRVGDADRLYERALSDANRQNVPADIADVAISWANALIVRGELARAVPVAGQIDRYAERDYASAVLQARLYRVLGRTEAWRSALDRARALAGERPLPDDLAMPPA